MCAPGTLYQHTQCAHLAWLTTSGVECGFLRHTQPPGRCAKQGKVCARPFFIVDTLVYCRGLMIADGEGVKCVYREVEREEDRLQRRGGDKCVYPDLHIASALGVLNFIYAKRFRQHPKWGENIIPFFSLRKSVLRLSESNFFLPFFCVWPPFGGGGGGMVYSFWCH